MSDPLFELVVQTSGLSPLFAGAALRRAFRRAGVSLDPLTPSGLQQSLPWIEQTLAVYLVSDDVAKRLHEIALLVSGDPIDFKTYRRL